MPARKHVPYETLKQRAARTKWIRIGVWIFIIVFAFSVVGGLFAIVPQAAR